MDKEHVANQGSSEIIGSYIALYGLNAFAFTWIFFPKFGFIYFASLLISSIVLHFITKDAFDNYKINHNRINKLILLAKINKEKIKYSRVTAILIRMFIMVLAISFSTNIADIMFKCPEYICMSVVPLIAAISGYIAAQKIISYGYYPHKTRNGQHDSVFDENFSEKITSDIACGIAPSGYWSDNNNPASGKDYLN